MTHRENTQSARRKDSVARENPWIIGAGLITLDIVLDATRPRRAVEHAVGGTCGNVLATLAYLGCRAEAIALLGADRAADAIFEELGEYGVATTHMQRETGGETARIAQEVVKVRGRDTRHRFLFSCPRCGARFARHRPPKWEQYEAMTGLGEIPDVFFFDRVSATTLALAEWLKDKGTLIYFEPSSIGRASEFKRAVEISDVVKYSEDRLHAALTDLGGLEAMVGRLPRVEIETMGAQGLRYRINAGPRRGGRWMTQGAFRAAPFLDAAGAGDWCSSGFLYRLLLERGSASGSELLTARRVGEALAFGQALAALSCLYLGPRTAALAAQRHQLLASAQAVQRNAETRGAPSTARQVGRRIEAVPGECSICLRVPGRQPTG